MIGCYYNNCKAREAEGFSMPINSISKPNGLEMECVTWMSRSNAQR